MEELSNIALARFTTLKVGGEANRLCQPSSSEELIALIERLKKSGEPWFALGGGSNLLVSSEGYDGTVIRMTQMQRIERLDNDVIEAEAGVRLPHLAKYAAQIGLSGLEFAVGIPGTVGGAAVMNAGAHGSCMSEITESVTIYDAASGKLQTLTQEELGFEYRRSKLDPNTQIVVSSRYRLKPDVAENIQEQTKHNEDYRWKTQPLGWPNAGSTFKNPEPKRGAGFLLDQAGAKQLREGNAAVSAVHANFVINLGGATSQEITGLLRRMQESVYEQFAIRLHPEWKTLGKFSQTEQQIWSE
ncbi:MAG TPA: UDP-N-acetylmuramate dehydrogenase [Candidatus Obscuribacterales bacterium]